MSKQTYVNRHGKTVSVEEETVVVTPISPVVEEKVTPKVTKQKSVAEPRAKRQWRRPHVPSRVLRVVAVLAVILAIAGVFLLQVGSSSYASAANSMEQRLTSLKQQTTKTNVPLSATVDSLLQSLPQIACPKPIVAFSLTKQAKDTKTRCEQMEARYISVKSQLDKVKSLSSYMTGLEKAMGDALVNPADGNFAVITTYEGRWKTAEAELAALQPPAFADAQHDELVKSAANVSDVWSRLAKADADHDADGYDKAVADLSLAYESFRGSSDQILALSLDVQKKLLAHLQ